LLHDVLDASKHVAVQRQISEQLGRVGYWKHYYKSRTASVLHDFISC